MVSIVRTLVGLLCFLPLVLAVNPGVKVNETRVQRCDSYSLPAAYEQYASTGFLGDLRHVEVGSVLYAYYSFGPLEPGPRGRPLVLLNGLYKTLADWPGDLLKPLAATREVIIFDNRGIGDSNDSYTGNYTVQSYADSTVELFEALNLAKPDVLGWALGGFIALALAVDHPDSINRIVVADTTLGGTSFGKTAAGQQELASINVIAPAFAAGEITPTSNYFPDDPAGNDALCRYLKLIAAMPPDAASHEATVKQGQVELNWHGPGGEFVYVGLSNISNPLLIIGGNKDLQNPIVTQLAILNGVPSAQILIYADAGHTALFQYSLQSAGYVNAFLSDDDGVITSSSS